MFKELMNQLFKEFEKAVRESDAMATPSFCIYMNERALFEMKSHISGAVSSEEYEFFMSDKINGWPVFRVIDTNHPAWRIVRTDNNPT